MRKRLVISAIVVATLLLVWRMVPLSPPKPMPSAMLRVEGTPGQKFEGVILTNGNTVKVIGTVPASFALGTGKFEARTWMTNGPGCLTNVVYRETNLWAVAQTSMVGERIDFERDRKGGISVGKSPSNMVLRFTLPF